MMGIIKQTGKNPHRVELAKLSATLGQLTKRKK